MIEIAQVSMGQTGRAWVSECLSRGGPLAKALHQSIDLEAGEVIALVPPDTPVERLAEPEWGGVVTEGDTEGELDAIAGDLIAKGATYVIAEDDMSREGDPILEGEEGVVPIGGGYVVFCASLPTVDAFHEHVECGYPAAAFIVSTGEGESCMDAIDVIKRGQADLVKAITVGAYDAETWMIWIRESPPS